MSPRNLIQWGSTLLCSGWLFYFASHVAYAGVSGSTYLVPSLLLTALMVTVGTGLVLQWFWARRTVAALLVLSAIASVFGFFNPFNALDMPDAQLPPLSDVLAWMIPVVAGLLLMAWALDPPNEAQPNNALERPNEN